MRESILALMVVATLTGPSCGPSAAPPAASTERADPAVPPARTLPIPGAAPAPTAAPRETPATLRWDVPEGWVVEQPAGRMRHAQYRAEGPGGPAECLVFYFGPGQGGEARANAERWAHQFEQPDGGSSLDAMRITTLDGAKLPVALVEVTGTYSGGMTSSALPAARQPDAMLLGAIVEGPDAPWFFKFTGPRRTVESQRETFLGMLSSVHIGP